MREGDFDFAPSLAADKRALSTAQLFEGDAQWFEHHILGGECRQAGLLGVCGCWSLGRRPTIPTSFLR